MPDMNAREHENVLTVTSLLSIFLFSVHVTHDIVRGVDTWGPNSLIGVAILVVLLCGPLVLRDRRSGLIIMLIGGIGAAGMPVLHRRATNVAHSNADFGLFIWTLFALGALGTLSAILAARALWTRRAGGTMTATRE